MPDAKISALTAASVPDGTEILPLVQGLATRRATLRELQQTALMLLDAAYTLTSTTAAQRLFNGSTNGRLTLPTGWYVFEALVALTSMSATSGNAQFQLLGAGSAVLGPVLYHTVGIDGLNNTAAAQTGSWSTASSSPAAAVTAGTATAMLMNIRGSFEVTTAGTIVPSIALLTAAAAIVSAGSFFRCTRVGPVNANAVIGAWD